MIDLGAHGMYLSEWILGMPVSASSVFTVSCDAEEAKRKNSDGLEDNAVTVMRYEGGAIAVNETGFVSECSPIVFEVHGEDGYVRMEGERVIKCTKATHGQPTEVALPDALPLPIDRFLTGDNTDDCSIEHAKKLTRLMVMAYQGQ